jgi:hypothetical protein
MTNRARLDAWLNHYLLAKKSQFPPDMLLACWQASRRAALEEACAAVKAEDDRQADNDYMLDSDDCIRVIRNLANGETNG